MRKFLLSRWRGETPLSTVLWRDMILVTTALNILTGIAAVILLASGVSAAIAFTVHFALAPWNIFLVLAVWRGSEKARMSEALIARFIALVWLAIVMVI